MARPPLGLGDRLHERADVGNERETFLAGEHACASRHLMQLHAGWMQAEIIRRRTKLKNGVTIQRKSTTAAKRTTRDGVGGIARLFPRDEDVE